MFSEFFRYQLRSLLVKLYSVANQKELEVTNSLYVSIELVLLLLLLLCRMSEQDVMTQSFLYSWIVPILFLGSIYMLLRKYGGYLKDRWLLFLYSMKLLHVSVKHVIWRYFASMWKTENLKYHAAMRDMKKEHFHSMNYHKSHDIELKNKGLIRILEIGAGTGQFTFVPDKLFSLIFNHPVYNLKIRS